MVESPLTPNPAEDADQALLRLVRARTPARVLTGPAAPAYTTRDWLELRRDHAFALDAVHREMDLRRHLGDDFVQRWGLFEVQTQARSKDEYLRRPDLGRRLSEAARGELSRRLPQGADVQVAIGDGLSTAALAAQVPILLPALADEIKAAGWHMGPPFAIRYCRVGVMNDVGELLDPGVVVLLIGERPGLATALSLSAYLAYRPRPGDTDARRNLISNIHERGVSAAAAAARILALIRKLLAARTSGVSIKEAGGLLEKAREIC